MNKFVIGTLISLACAASYANGQDNLITTNNGQVSIKPDAMSILQDSMATKQDSYLTKRDLILTSYGERVGEQYGYAHQLEYLQKKIEKKAPELSKIFNFKFILSYANKNSPAVNILPPVLLKAQDFVQDNNGESITLSNQHYTLYAQAKLVTVVPTWRSYLINPIPKPMNLTNGFLPHDSQEKAVWSKAIKRGWEMGIVQANEEMDYRINLLSRDYNGMITYLKLLDEGKVSSPYVAYTHQSVVGDGDAMSVNQSVYRITSPSKLITNPKEWKFQSQGSI